MTTASLEHDRTTRRSAAARLGAIAGVTPIVMFLAWNAISGWGGTPLQFVQASAVITPVALVAGWIIGARSSGSVRQTIVGVVAYPALAWLLMLPIGTIFSTTPWGVLYGLVASLYVIPLLTPFGAGWALTYSLLRRGMHV